MTTNQEVIIEALQTQLGAGYEDYTYEGLWHAFWDNEAIDIGTFDERMLAWINVRLNESNVTLPGAMQSYAESLGFYDWDSMNEFTLGEDVVTGPGADTGEAFGLLLALTYQA